VSSLALAAAGALVVIRSIPLSASSEPAAVIATGPVVHGTPPTTTPPSTTTAARRPAPASTAPPATPAPTVATTPAAQPSAPAQVAARGVVAAAASADSYAFEIRNADGSPARWDPCTPIHYVVNLAAAPPTAAADISTAIARVETATGMTFISDGTTSELPSRSRPNEDTARYGHRWSPVLLAWAHTGTTDYLAGDGVLGEGGATWVAPAGGRDVYVTGEVAINADTTTTLGSGFGAGTTIGLLLLHEFGHVMGLAHAGDPNEVMYPRLLPRGAAAYAPGDLAGLGILAGGGCHPAPAAP